MITSSTYFKASALRTLEKEGKYVRKRKEEVEEGYKEDQLQVKLPSPISLLTVYKNIKGKMQREREETKKNQRCCGGDRVGYRRKIQAT